jgi:pyruvate/2-oxoglutarate dehydrogenase complex dihydrolipoamide acyltransferase (E2) component
MSRNVRGRYANRVSSWRRLATANWQAANDPTIYGTVDLDATRALDYVARCSGGLHHVTITHLVTKAVAESLARHPECNAYVRRGRVFVREDIDVFVLVAVPPDAHSGAASDLTVDLTGVKVSRANEKTVAEIAAEIAERVGRLRAGLDPDFARVKRLMDSVPPLLLRPIFAAIIFALYELNLDLSRFGVPRDAFGSAFVTSVGMLGLEHAFPPIVPMTRLALNVCVGRIEDRPVAEKGQVVVRPVLPLTATFDHRVIDGYHAGLLSETFTAILRDPAAYFGEPAPSKHEPAISASATTAVLT